MRDCALVEIEPRHDPPHRLDRGLAGERGNIRADKAVSDAGEFVQIDFGLQRHPAGVDA